MKILILAEVDHTGAGYALMQAINKYTAHEARAVSFRRSYLEYPFDVLAPNSGERRRLIEWADVVNIHDQAGKYLDGMPVRPVVTTYHGTWYRRRFAKVNKRDAARGWRQTCFTLGLSRLGPRWIGRPVEDLSGLIVPIWEYRVRDFPGGFWVHHCATNRVRKGTAAIREILGRARGIKLDLVVQTPNIECLKRRSRCHAVVDRFGEKAIGTIGTTAIESFSMGLPVISWATPDDLGFIEDVVGYVPFISAVRARELAEAVARLKDDPEFYNERRAVGRRYVSEWHDPATIARRFIEYVS